MKSISKKIKYQQLALVCFLMAFCFNMNAHCIYNKLNVKISVKVTKGDFDTEISPNDNACCNYSNTDCHPNGNQKTSLYTAQISIPDLKVFHIVKLEAGGYINVEFHQEEMGIQEIVVTKSWRADGTLLQSWPVISNPTKRDVRFVVTGDPQLSNSWENNTSEENYVRVKKVMSEMVNKVKTNKARGILISGDLTQNSRMDEYKMYQKTFSGYARYVFDGYGNHDLHEGSGCGGWSDFSASLGSLIDENGWSVIPDYCVSPEIIREDIKNRSRITPVNMNSNGHYSWDWHDVHFVQLNLYPGDEGTHDYNHPSDRDATLKPHNSLTFLKNDLKQNVGKSGRPIVLIHHYGFESFSRGFGSNCRISGRNNPNKDGCNTWWPQEAREQYWDALADYNVIGIFTGHLHSGTNLSNQFTTNWSRPNNKSNGPEFIPTFTSGGAKGGGYYLDVSIDNGEMKINRYQYKNSRFQSAGSKNISISGITSKETLGKFIRLNNRHLKTQIYSDDAHKIKASKMDAGAWRAHWEMEYLPGKKFARIKNRHTNTYLYADNNHNLKAGPQDIGAWRAHWIVEKVKGTSAFSFYWILKNRYTNESITCSDAGVLSMAKVDAGAWRTHWEISTVETDIAKKEISDKFVRVNNRYLKTQIYSDDAHKIKASKMDAGAWRADWKMEYLPGKKYVRIKNRYKNTYLYADDNHNLKAGAQDIGAWRAHWILEKVKGTSFVWLKNRYTNESITCSNEGILTMAKVDAGAWRAHWEIK